MSMHKIISFVIVASSFLFSNSNYCMQACRALAVMARRSNGQRILAGTLARHRIISRLLSNVANISSARRRMSISRLPSEVANISSGQAAQPGRDATKQSKITFHYILDENQETIATEMFLELNSIVNISDREKRRREMLEIINLAKNFAGKASRNGVLSREKGDELLIKVWKLEDFIVGEKFKHVPL